MLPIEALIINVDSFIASILVVYKKKFQQNLKHFKLILLPLITSWMHWYLILCIFNMISQCDLGTKCCIFQWLYLNSYHKMYIYSMFLSSFRLPFYFALRLSRGSVFRFTTICLLQCWVVGPSLYTHPEAPDH